MKTLGRTLIILTAFSIVMGITYLVVNTGSSSTSTNMPAPEREQRVEGVAPQFSGDERFEFHDEDREGEGGWIFGLIKNVGIIAIVIALTSLLKKIPQRKIVSARVE